MDRRKPLATWSTIASVFSSLAALNCKSPLLTDHRPILFQGLAAQFLAAAGGRQKMQTEVLLLKLPLMAGFCF
jgi:hypothetical protein